MKSHLQDVQEDERNENHHRSEEREGREVQVADE